MANVFKENYDSTTVTILDELVVDNEDKTSSVDLTNRLESTTRDSTARVILVFSNSVIGSQILHSADSSVMGGSGYVWILNSISMIDLPAIAQDSHADLDSTTFGVLKTGAIGFLEEDSIYLSQNPLGVIKAGLTLVCQGYVYLNYPKKSLSRIGGYDLKAYMMTNPATPTLPYPLHFDSSGKKQSSYSLFNMQEFVPYKVGYWDQSSRKIVITNEEASIIWPGLGTSVPDDQTPIIKIGLLYPLHDSDGNPFKYGTGIQKGFELASKLVNDAKMLGDYKINGVYKDTLMTASLASVYIRSLGSENILGYIGPYNTEEATAYIGALANSADPKPLVSYGATGANLTSSETYPRFLRTIQPDGLQAVAVAMFIQQQGWKKIGVIYTNDEFGIGIYNSFITNVQTLEITIKNKESKRKITAAVNGIITDDVKSDVDEALKEIIRNQIKIIVYLGSDVTGAELAKQGYDKTLYGSDYAWVGAMWITDNLFSVITSSYSKSDQSNILEVINGAYGLGFRGPIDTVGKTFDEAYYAAYAEDPTTYAMLTYDTVYLYAWTIQSMINRGEDFNNGKQLMDSLRSADYTGASGKVKFSEGTNDRSAYGYTVINYQHSKVVSVKEYDPLNPNMFTDYNVSLVWGGGHSSAPTDSWGSKYDCPFPKNMVSIDFDGVIIVICIGIFMFFLTLALSMFSYRKWKQVEIQQINDPVIRSWKDTLVQATIAVEFFQFVAIAPTFASLKIVIEAASNVFMIDIMKVANSGKQTYWTLLVVVCGLCYAWFFLVIMIMANAEYWLRKVPFCQRVLGILNALYLPFFGNTMFLPFTALLLDAYVCDHKAQNKAWVFRDCYMTCWGADHSPYIIMAGLALACYEPVAVFSRPLWQQAKTGLNLMAKPFFLLFKTCVQILLIAIGKSLQGTSQLAFGIVFSFLFATFTGLTYKIQPFNYNRCNLWEFASLCAVSYLSILATISNSADPKNIGWFIALMIGWGVIVVSAFIVQKKYMQNLLLPPGGGRNQRKVYDALSLRKSINDSDYDNSELALKPGDISIADPSVLEPKDYRVVPNIIRNDEENENENEQEQEHEQEQINMPEIEQDREEVSEGQINMSSAQ